MSDREVPDSERTSDSTPPQLGSDGVTLQAEDTPNANPNATVDHSPRSASRSRIKPNEVSIPGYEVLDILGHGAMGVVYKARQLALKRFVAVKMILARGHASSNEVARFRIEAEAVARLQHPNIVQIYEINETGGHPYFALEFVDGGTLAGKLENKPMSAREAAQMVEALARAMELAHSRNVVHRDLKPANVLLTPDGSPKITDFGLARQTDNDSGQTQAGAIMGTPAYMAPEQASGRANEAGPAADIYALGAILFACLTGRPPFQGATVVETLDMVRNVEPLPPSRFQRNIPADLETICLKALAKEIPGRYLTAADLAADLRRFLNDEPIVARRATMAERVWRSVRRNPVMFALSGAVLLLLIGFVLLAMPSRKEPPSEAAPTASDTSAEDLVAIVAKLDKAEPNWRLEQINAQRHAPEEDQDGGRLLLPFRKAAAEMRKGPVAEGQWAPPELEDRFAQMRKLAPTTRLTPQDTEFLREQLRPMAKGLDIARRLAKFPQGQFPTANKRDAVSTLLPDQAAGRHLLLLLQVDVWLRVQDGDRTGAVTSCEAAFNLARYYTDEPLVIGHLMRAVIITQAIALMERILAQSECTEAELSQIQEILRQEESKEVLVLTAKAHRGATHYFLTSLAAGDVPPETLQGLFGITDPAQTPKPKEIRQLHAWLLEHLSELVALAKLPIERQPEALRKLDEKMNQSPLAGTPLFEGLTKDVFAPGPHRVSMGRMLVEGHWKHLAQMRTAQAALAIERTRMANGGWPATLNALLPKFLPQQLKDPFDQQPLRYQKIEDGVVIYSIGGDLKDDQGRWARNNHQEKDGDIGFRLWNVEKRSGGTK